MALAEQVTDPLLTCEAVMAEASFHLRNTALVLAMAQDGLIMPVFNVIDQIDQLLELANRYRDQQPDLADLCLIRLSEMHPRHSVITVDVTDFRIYRRNKRERIPLISP